MAVFLGYLLLCCLAGILLRHRPYAQTQMVVAALTVILAVCYFAFGML